MVAQGKESTARCDKTRMAGERINNPATKSGCSSVGRTPHLGCGGREFKSHHSDQPLWLVERCLKVGNTRRRLRKAKQRYDDGNISH